MSAEQGINYALMDALDFGPEELEANRQGVLSNQQKSKLGKNTAGTNIASLVMFIVLLVFMGIAGYMLISTGSAAGFIRGFAKDPSTLLIVGGALGIVALIILMSFLRTLLRANRVGRGKISMVAGPVKLEALRVPLSYAIASKAMGDSAYTHMLKIGREKFYLQKKALNGFQTGRTYRLYYVKNSPFHYLLSAEMIRSR
jgi:hypothetical protein